MGNTNLCTEVLQCLTFTTLYLAFLLLHLSNTLAINSPSPYKPVDNIILNCGSSDNSTALDGRTWNGDVNSKFFPQELSQNQASLATNSVKQSSSASQVPYTTARLSVSPFTYIFPLTTGQKFVRLYFYPATYSNFDRSNALFSVKAGTFTLLRDFNASLTADADGDPDDTIFREFCIDIVEDLRLNITFTPSNSNSFAFVNGIEILSMPFYLYYTSSDDNRFPLIGEEYLFSIDNGTALETVYRINVGGKYISPTEDTGMFRSWNPDEEYLTEDLTSVLPVNTTIDLMFTNIPPYTAPEAVYRTARTMGTNKTVNKMYNLTWEFPVDSEFYYLVRLHFCEFQPEITFIHNRVFLIFIANQTAETAANVWKWADSRKAVPVYKDYAVSTFGEESKKKMNLSIALQANQDDYVSNFNDAILNGIEIFKVSDFSGNLAGPNPEPVPLTPPKSLPPIQSTESKKNIRTPIIAIVGGGVSGLTILLILVVLIFRLAKKVKYSENSTKASGSTLPCSLSRYFSLAEIKAATNNFDEVFIIGSGGFGDVYKGYINGSEATPVAIKRLKSGSQQGALEFRTEISMLSQLRHLHLVSLIGYCEDGNEKILVYDYMAHGTLRDHLYNTKYQPLCWKQRLQICLGAAHGLNYLHTGATYTIIHRDMKTTNILLDDQWLAKVSDFGLSKFGPVMSKSHVSTVVKGTFGYLDPEYYRFQQLTEKSDVYSFGVVLCEVLCGRPPITRTIEEQPMGLAAWVLQCYHNGKLDEIVDPSLKGEIEPECLKKFGEIVVNCLLDNGTKRPSMNDVVGGLELALELQESAEKDVRLDLAEEIDINDDDEHALIPMSDVNESDDMIFCSSGKLSSTNSNSQVTVVSRGSFASKDSDGLMSPRAVFSEIMDPKGR
ncbi:receptor-like protein kinase FERONIA [Quercus lobata]|uniref:Protein kinase domain-containing protein n=1 Tax=Quercus lobata TaxID=97700 RepID=A0A7N2KZA2_QUELO|nr:receptor-like protein kinase FERONIA [Quercus lobata]